MYGPIKHFIFDMDGTLIDSMGHALAGFRKSYELSAGEPLEDEKLFSALGAAPGAMFAQWFEPGVRLESALAHWEAYNRQLNAQTIPAFEGVEELLTEIKERNLALSLLTGRDRKTTLVFMQMHGWLGKFFNEGDLVCGDDEFLPKPDPKGLLHLVEKKHTSKEESLMVGDHHKDMEAARAAGVRAAAALWDKSNPHVAAAKSSKDSFRRSWANWDELDVDLRLDSPRSLHQWLS